MIEAAKVAERLGGREVLGADVTTDLELYAMVAQGFQPRVVDALVRNRVISKKELGLLDIAPRTLARRKSKGQALTVAESDRIARLARIAAYAEEVFADEGKAATWLRTPNGALGEHPPLELATTETGARLVETALDRIAFGDYT